MTHATGKRLFAALCFLVGGLTIIGIPILWPLAYIYYKKAKKAERRAEKREELLEQQLNNVD